MFIMLICIIVYIIIIIVIVIVIVILVIIICITIIFTVIIINRPNPGGRRARAGPPGGSARRTLGSIWGVY